MRSSHLHEGEKEGGEEKERGREGISERGGRGKKEGRRRKEEGGGRRRGREEDKEGWKRWQGGEVERNLSAVITSQSWTTNPIPLQIGVYQGPSVCYNL